MLPFGFLSRLPEQIPVAFHQFPDQQEGIDSCDTVCYQTRDILAFRITFTLDEGLIPQGTELCAVLLDRVGEFLLPESDLFQSVVFSGLFLDGKHERGILVHKQAGQEAHQWLLNPTLTKDDEEYKQQQMDSRDNQEGCGHAEPCSHPTGNAKGEIQEYGDDEKEKQDSQGGSCQ